MGIFSEVKVERLEMSTVCTVLSPEWLDVLCRENSGGSRGPATHHLLILDRPRQQCWVLFWEGMGQSLLPYKPGGGEEHGGLLMSCLGGFFFFFFFN